MEQKGEVKVKRTDIVELLVDKDEYMAKGVQKGMRGRITDYGVPQENEKRKVFFVLGKTDNRFIVTAVDIPEDDLRVVDEWIYPNGEKIVLPFNEYARVVMTEEKEKYADDGVHKGFDGWICDPRRIENSRLICFDMVDFSPYPIISVKERDMEVLIPAKEDLIDYEEWSKKGK